MASTQARRERSTEEGSRAVKIEVVDVEKVKGLSKYYLYVLKVLCKDGSSYFIRRRYRQFDEMENALEKRFPIEAGAIKVTDRTLPKLPNKVYIGRSAVREVADKRLPHLNEYLRTLLSLPDKIRYDTIVLGFVQQTADDLARPYFGNQAYKSRPNASSKPNRPALPPTKPDKPALPPFLQKSAGSSKGGFRPPLPPPPSSVTSTKKTPPPPSFAPPTKILVGPTGEVVKGPRAKTVYAYRARHPDELSFPEGVVIGLVKQTDGDWWEGQYKGKSGLVPGNYIDIIQMPVRVDLKDQINSSDEWDSSENEDDKGKLTYYFNQAPRTMDIELNVVRNPNRLSLLRAIQNHLHKRNIVLNYKDKDDDLIEIVDNKDMELLKMDGQPPKKLLGNCHAPWAIYVTLEGDHTPYNTSLPGYPRR